AGRSVVNSAKYSHALKRGDEDGAPFTITVTVHHEGIDATASRAASVCDPAPLAAGVASFSAVEGAASDRQVLATFTDPGGVEPVRDYTATIIYALALHDALPIWAERSVVNSAKYSHALKRGDEDGAPFTITVTVHHEGIDATA